ncbi:hypothetical protein GWK08_03350 [Leptobacterium flavescens]|uniref:Uncharacterized protein n=1 Tax=Leptobacterium flavescens TaxID=472055 RepID=A0A6P0UGU7_9FLAO|nr:hypothetical protein [Leptobacterium flavescens]NER12464.1 hypothetical protein [Leptobacterium flavescens]
MKLLTATITAIFGIYLISLFVLTLVSKGVAVKFLSSFASSARAHYLEQLLRLIVGGSVLYYSADMLYPVIFKFFGWIVLATTIVLILTPWTWHHKFGQWAIPFAIRNIVFYSISAAIMGIFILYCVFKPLFLS